MSSVDLSLSQDLDDDEAARQRKAGDGAEGDPEIGVLDDEVQHCGVRRQHDEDAEGADMADPA